MHIAPVTIVLSLLLRFANRRSDIYAVVRPDVRVTVRMYVVGCRTSITHWPCIGGRPLDLYTLYTSVIKLGGWEKVRYRPYQLVTLLVNVIALKHPCTVQ